MQRALVCLLLPLVQKVFEAASYAAQHGLYICCVAEDASRADLGFLIDYAKVAKRTYLVNLLKEKGAN